VFLFALLVRVPGITWGLPNGLHNQSYHPDEQVIFNYSQGVDVGHGSFLPGNYSYGTLYLTLLSIASKVVSGYGGGIGTTAASYWSFIANVDLAGRILSALAGAGTCLVIFLLLRRQTGALGALAGGLLLAISPGFVVHSRFQTVDVTATFLLALSLYFSTLLLPSERDANVTEAKFVKFAVLAGLFAGLSAGTKYTGILALLSLIASCAFATSKVRCKGLALGVVVSLVAFVVATPGAVFDHTHFMRDFDYELRHTSTGHDLVFVDVGSGFLYHIVNMLSGMTPFLFVMASAGAGAALYKRKAWMLVLLSFSLVYYILIGRADVLFLRYTFPLYLILACGFGWWIGQSHIRGGKHRVSVGLGILALGVAALSTAQYTAWMAGEDPRDTTAKILKEESANNPSTTVGIVSDPWFYTPPLIPDTASMRGIWPFAPARPVETAQLEEMTASKSPKLVQYAPEGRFDWDTRLITELKPDYIVFSSFEEYDVDRLQTAQNLDSTDQLKVNRYRDFAKLLTASYSPAYWENPDFPTIHDLEYVHPYIYLWKRKGLH
jgi:4-amino-4-deoxy-L-arabinose transferase-like glycosyltransferase